MLTASTVPRRAGIAIFASLTCAASAYLFLPSGPSRAAPTDDNKPLSADHFTPSIVLANDDAGPDTKIITLQVKPALVPLHFLRRSSPSSNGDPSIYSLFVKDSDIQVERPYTPLQCADEEGKMRFWVKRYKNGEVGRWLHSRKQGDVVELRGPVTTWDWSWRPNDEGWDEIVMISGGTGITPFYQFLHSMFASPAKSQGDLPTRYILLHASKTPADLPPPSILGTLSKFASERPDVFKMHLFVDSIPEESLDATSHHLLQVGRIGKAVIHHTLGLNGQDQSWWKFVSRKKGEQPQKRRLFLVCGPEAMITAISGPYGRNLSQGHVGGILGGMGCTQKEVWKL